MHIRQIDITQDDDLSMVLPAWHDFTASTLPGPGFGAHRLRFDAGVGLDSECLNLAAFADEQAESAAGLITVRLERTTNTDLGDAYVFLRADQSETTVADALLTAARTRLAQSGRTRLHINVPQTAPSPAYAPLYSPTPAFTSVCSTLDLSAVDRQQFAEWAAPSPENKDFQIVHWIDRCPDELIESYTVCLKAMDDAPLEDLNVEHSERSVARLRQAEALTVGYGVKRYVVAAVTEKGEVAGFTQSVWTPEEPEVLDLWSTAVIRAHRGHGLGLRIKAASTLKFVDDLPGAKWVMTFNNHANEHMLAVNRRLGYQALRTWEIHEFPADAFEYTAIVNDLGDDGFEAHRPYLGAVAYRLLGSFTDAEDAVQDTWLRWRDVDRSQVLDARAYLTRVITRICYDVLGSARVRRETYFGEWLPEPEVTDEHTPESAVVLGESVSLALLAVLEQLTPAQRVAFVLHDVFRIGFDQIGAALDRSPESVRQLAVRARRDVQRRSPHRNVDVVAHRRAVAAFAAALSGADVSALVDVLAPEVIWHADGGGIVTAALKPVVGALRVARMAANLSKKWLTPETGVITRAVTVNGEPGLAGYLPSGEPFGVIALTVAEGRVAEVFIVVNPEKLKSVARITVTP